MPGPSSVTATTTWSRTRRAPTDTVLRACRSALSTRAVTARCSATAEPTTSAGSAAGPGSCSATPRSCATAPADRTTSRQSAVRSTSRCGLSVRGSAASSRSSRIAVRCALSATTPSTSQRAWSASEPAVSGPPSDQTRGGSPPSRTFRRRRRSSCARVPSRVSGVRSSCPASATNRRWSASMADSGSSARRLSHVPAAAASSRPTAPAASIAARIRLRSSCRGVRSSTAWTTNPSVRRSVMTR